MQEGLANVCLVTSCMTIVRAKIDVAIPRKRRGSATQHEKALERFYDTVLQADILFLKHDSGIFRQSSNPACNSRKSQARGLSYKKVRFIDRKFRPFRSFETNFLIHRRDLCSPWAKHHKLNIMEKPHTERGVLSVARF